jgi:hypothetical protein
MSYNDAANYSEWAVKQAKSRAEEKYPLLWYQKDWVQNMVLVCIGVVLGGYQLYVGWENVSSLFIGLAIITFLIGWIADTWTTVYAFRLLPEYRKRGLQYPLFEWNPFLLNYPTLRDQIYSFSSLIKIITLLLTPLVPAAGWGSAWSSLSAAMNNWRNARYTRYQLEQYDTLMFAAEKEKRYPKVSRTRTGLTPIPDDHRRCTEYRINAFV